MCGDLEGLGEHLRTILGGSEGVAFSVKMKRYKTVGILRAEV